MTTTRQSAGNTGMTPARPRDGQRERQRTRQLTRWSPFALLDELQDEFARLRPSTLRLDVFEDSGSIVVKADVPGVRKEDIQVEVDDGDLVIQGETRSENEVKEDQYYRMERRVGRFYRRVPLGFNVNPDDVQATMNNGVLEVRIPKPAESESKGRRIQVR